MWLVTVCVFVTLPLAMARPGQGQGKDDAVKQELRQLLVTYNEAGSKRDRAALEQLFADEYVWFQANGNTVDKTKQIDGIMGNDAQFVVPVSSFDQVHVYGDVAVNRGIFPAGVTSTVYAKKNGRWQFVQAQSTRLAPERRAVVVEPKALDSLVGRYELSPGAFATVTKEGDALMWQGGRRPKVRLMPLSEARFFAEGTDLEMIFRRDDKGQATHVTMRQGTCLESELKKVVE